VTNTFRAQPTSWAFLLPEGSVMPERLEQTTSSIAYTGSIGAGAVGVFSWNEMLMIVAALTGLITAGVNWYYRHKHYKLALMRVEKEFLQSEDEDSRPG